MQTYGEMDLYSSNKYIGDIDARDSGICCERRYKMPAEWKAAFGFVNGLEFRLTI